MSRILFKEELIKAITSNKSDKLGQVCVVRGGIGLSLLYSRIANISGNQLLCLLASWRGSQSYSNPSVTKAR